MFPSNTNTLCSNCLPATKASIIAMKQKILSLIPASQASPQLIQLPHSCFEILCYLVGTLPVLLLLLLIKTYSPELSLYCFWSHGRFLLYTLSQLIEPLFQISTISCSAWTMLENSLQCAVISTMGWSRIWRSAWVLLLPWIWWWLKNVGLCRRSCLLASETKQMIRTRQVVEHGGYGSR